MLMCLKSLLLLTIKLKIDRGFESWGTAPNVVTILTWGLTLLNKTSKMYTEDVSHNIKKKKTHSDMLCVGSVLEVNFLYSTSCYAKFRVFHNVYVSWLRMCRLETKVISQINFNGEDLKKSEHFRRNEIYIFPYLW